MIIVGYLQFVEIKHLHQHRVQLGAELQQW
jgi:hypothetical protein